MSEVKKRRAFPENYQFWHDFCLAFAAKLQSQQLTKVCRLRWREVDRATLPQLSR